MKIGYGGGAIADYPWNQPSSLNDEQILNLYKVVTDVFNLRMKFIDTASRYGGGMSEKIIGDVFNIFNQKFNSERYFPFLTTKIELGTVEQMLESLCKSIARLGGLPDCLLLHNPDFGKGPLLAEACTWLVKRVRIIGIPHVGISTEPTEEAKFLYEDFDLDAIQFPFSWKDQRALRTMKWVRGGKIKYKFVNRILGGPTEGGWNLDDLNMAFKFLKEYPEFFDVALVGTTNVEHLKQLIALAEG